jgi:hypothetical protein
MDFRIKDLITLEDNKEYIITSIAKYENNDYFYLVDINENENVKFCELILNNGTVGLLEIIDDELLSHIVPILYSNIKDEIAS